MFSRVWSTINKRLPTGYKQTWPSKFDNIVVAMSGGVDSSFTASLFAQYPNVKGIYMKNWDSNNNDVEGSPRQCDEQDWKDACQVSKYLNMPVEMINFEQDYWVDVFEPMLQDYQTGLTPNPDVLCNRYIKFGKLVTKLNEVYGSNNYWLVTGHYARILQDTVKMQYRLLRGIDKNKDQSYYLSQIESTVLSQVLLPLGHFRKSEVRKFASEVSLPNAVKPDSQGICFVNNSQQGKFKRFLREYLPQEVGNIITIDPSDGSKTVWGQHEGFWSYTLGQKIGISMPQGNPKYKGTWYVSEKIHSTNEIVISNKRDQKKALFTDQVSIGDFKPLHDVDYRLLSKSAEEGTLWFQHRSLQQPALVEKINRIFGRTDTLSWRPAAAEAGRLSPRSRPILQLQLAVPQRAMAAGQVGCLYRGEWVLGSGAICPRRRGQPTPAVDSVRVK